MNAADLIERVENHEAGVSTVLLEPRADYDPCIIGVFLDNEVDCYRLIYSESRVCEMLVTVQEMTMLDAAEFYEFNVAGAYLGPGTPVFAEEVTSA